MPEPCLYAREREIFGLLLARVVQKVYKTGPFSHILCRRQDNSDRRRLARQHLNDLLHSLTRERRGQNGVVSTALRHLSDRTFHVLGVRHMRIPSLYLIGGYKKNTGAWSSIAASTLS